MSRQSNLKARWNNRDVSPFNELALEYDAWFEKEGKHIFNTEVCAFEPLLPLLPKPWLEIGVGSGRFAQALGIEAGVDPSYKLVEMARKRGIDAFLGRGEQQSFADASWGTVFVIFTLCFLDSPEDVMLETKRILMPCGKLVLGVVLKESPWGRSYMKEKRKGHRFYKYATFYTFSEMERLLFRAGFSIEKVISTLFQKPGMVHHEEQPKKGYYHNAGFTVILAEKSGENVQAT